MNSHCQLRERETERKRRGGYEEKSPEMPEDLILGPFMGLRHISVDAGMNLKRCSQWWPKAEQLYPTNVFAIADSIILLVNTDLRVL